MKNNRFNYNSNVKEREMPTGLGVIFIKTRKFEDKIRKMTDEIADIADALAVQIIDAVIDDSYGGDIDRAAINELSF